MVRRRKSWERTVPQGPATSTSTGQTYQKNWLKVAAAGIMRCPRTDLLCAAGIQSTNQNQEIVRTNMEETERKITVSKFSTPGRTDGRSEGWILGESVGDGASQDGESRNQSETASSFIYPFSSEFGTFLTVVELYEGQLLLFVWLGTFY